MTKPTKRYKLIKQRNASEAVICGEICMLPDSENLDRALDILGRLATDQGGWVTDGRVTDRLVMEFVAALDYSQQHGRDVTIRNFSVVQHVLDFVNASNDFITPPAPVRMTAANKNRVMRYLERKTVYNKLCNHFGLGSTELSVDMNRYIGGPSWFYGYWERYINGDPIVTRLIRAICWIPPEGYFDEARRMHPDMEAEIARIQAI